MFRLIQIVSPSTVCFRPRGVVSPLLSSRNGWRVSHLLTRAELQKAPSAHQSPGAVLSELFSVIFIPKIPVTSVIGKYIAASVFNTTVQVVCFFMIWASCTWTEPMASCISSFESSLIAPSSSCSPCRDSMRDFKNSIGCCDLFFELRSKTSPHSCSSACAEILNASCASHRGLWSSARTRRKSVRLLKCSAPSPVSAIYARSLISLSAFPMLIRI